MEQTLSYSPPAHGGWNLAHICRLLPESHALFVTPAGCSRIILLSAAEAGLQGRFSALSVSANDIAAGGLEERMIEAAEEVLERYRPPALFIFTSCIADFIGLDRDVYLERLRVLHPGTLFLDGRMDPINRVSGLPPIVRMQNLFASVLEGSHKEKAVLFSGSFTPPEEGQELAEHLKSQGFLIRHAYRCATFSEFRAMGNCRLNVVLHPSAMPAAKELEKRLGMPWVSLAGCTQPSSLKEGYAQICELLGLPPVSTDEEEKSRQAVAALAQALAGRSVYLDDGFTPCPTALAARLLRGGVRVKCLFADGGAAAVSMGPADRQTLTDHAVTVVDYGTPEGARLYKEGRYADETAVCAGEMAAYAAHSGHYIAGLRFSGRFGFAGLRRTAEELAAAAQDSRPLTAIQRCGRGCFGL